MINDKKLREAMAEQGHELTLDEVRATKKSIVLKLYPELLETMTVDEALDYIVGLANEQSS